MKERNHEFVSKSVKDSSVKLFEAILEFTSSIFIFCKSSISFLNTNWKGAILFIIILLGTYLVIVEVISLKEIFLNIIK